MAFLWRVMTRSALRFRKVILGTVCARGQERHEGAVAGQLEGEKGGLGGVEREAGLENVIHPARSGRIASSGPMISPVGLASS